ncbi:MAG: DUF2188 domain-containing protein [Nitrospira sp.]|nr:DUF2188 domain-containing protein [Nitrospira sp.]
MANQHVVPFEGDWAVRPEHGEITSIHRTQQEAIDVARFQAQIEESELFIHRRNGQFRERNTYGRDPYPPPG